MSQPNQIAYSETGPRDLDRIRPLWEKLIEHHRVRSKHFAHFYINRRFDLRRKELQEKSVTGSLHLGLARNSATKKLAGYCVSSISAAGEGEIDSIYIEAEMRGCGIGDRLMQMGLQWMDSHSVKKKIIAVGAGNEEVLPFYQRFGFYPHRIVLEQIEPPKGQSYVLPVSGINRDIRYSVYDKTGLDLVQPLWEKLNRHQGSLSRYFPEYFAGREFAARKARWMQSAAGGELRVDMASDSKTNSPIGYCVSTASAANEGHIESIYLEPSYRRLKIGDNLMRRALLGMAGRQANRRSLTVAVGNEIVLPFYERFNFFPRRYILEQKKG